jgi:stage II sporulation protein D
LRRSLAPVLAAFLLVPAAAQARVDGLLAGSSGIGVPGPSARWFVTGHGWGHGVGLAQYGAYGLAQHGWTYQRILAWYYRGTTLGRSPVRRLRVLLAQGRSAVTIASPVDFKVIDADGKSHAVAAGTYKLGPKLALKIDVATKAQPLPGPVVFAPGSQPLRLGTPYRGQIQVSAVNGKLRAVNLVGLEQYLYGVVPREMPFDWDEEALKAQAVAARSYALVHLHKGAFDLYSDTRSQVYGGVAAEKASSNEAAAATAGEVLTYAGRIANTVFSSTSGGRTLSAKDAWGQDVPYLVSVPDPYDSISPYHDWGPYAFTGLKLGQTLHVPGSLVDVETTKNGSGRVASVVGTGTAGQVTVPAAQARTRLGLRSTWFDLGVLSLTPPAGGRMTYGGTATLTGVARDLRSVELQQRAATESAWVSFGSVAPGASGAFSVSARPKVTTTYRLVAGKASSTAAKVSVAPLVRLDQPTSATRLTGSVRPVLPGATVELERLKGDAWSTVAKAQLDNRGSYSADLLLVPGSYRARVAPGGGLVPGTSKVLRVVGA